MGRAPYPCFFPFYGPKRHRIVIFGGVLSPVCGVSSWHRARLSRTRRESSRVLAGPRSSREMAANS